MKFKQMMGKATHNLKKHSPAIFTGVGIVGLGATAYLAYKSRDKVEAVVSDMEYKNENDIPVNKMEVARDMTEAIYKPVVMGTASITCILLAHRIQHKRILTLAGALAVEQSRNIYFEQKYKKVHGQEAYDKFTSPVEEVEEVEIGKNGKEKITVTEVKSEIDKTIGQWYSDSEEYVKDDPTYNREWIRSIDDKLQTVMFQRGQLTLNEVREALGFERIRAGALLGWSTGDAFEIETRTMNVGDEEAGESREQLYVTWTKPRYIYEEIEFNGRYSI